MSGQQYKFKYSIPMRRPASYSPSPGTTPFHFPSDSICSVNINSQKNIMKAQKIKITKSVKQCIHILSSPARGNGKRLLAAIVRCLPHLVSDHRMSCSDLLTGGSILGLTSSNTW